LTTSTDESARFSSLRGLSEAEARETLNAEGFNELPRPDHRTPLRIVLEVLREPMLALLLAGGGIYLLLGDPREALILLAFASMSVVITVVQETRTEHVLEALRDLTSPRALVIRDGAHRRIPGREVVRGDIVVLAEGDRVPADGALLRCRDLLADESLLTGESLPVRKTVTTSASPAGVRPGGDDLPNVYSGSLIVRGSGIAEVRATGPRSEIGKVGQSLRSLETEPPRLRAQTARLVRMSAIAGALVSVLALVLYGTLRGGWLEAASEPDGGRRVAPRAIDCQRHHDGEKSRCGAGISHEASRHLGAHPARHATDTKHPRGLVGVPVKVGFGQAELAQFEIRVGGRRIGQRIDLGQ